MYWHIGKFLWPLCIKCYVHTSKIPWPGSCPCYSVLGQCKSYLGNLSASWCRMNSINWFSDNISNSMPFPILKAFEINGIAVIRVVFLWKYIYWDFFFLSEMMFQKHGQYQDQFLVPCSLPTPISPLHLVVKDP